MKKEEKPQCMVEKEAKNGTNHKMLWFRIIKSTKFCETERKKCRKALDKEALT